MIAQVGCVHSGWKSLARVKILNSVSDIICASECKYLIPDTVFYFCKFLHYKHQHLLESRPDITTLFGSYRETEVN